MQHSFSAIPTTQTAYYQPAPPVVAHGLPLLGLPPLTLAYKLSAVGIQQKALTIASQNQASSYTNRQQAMATLAQLKNTGRPVGMATVTSSHQGDSFTPLSTSTTEAPTPDFTSSASWQPDAAKPATPKAVAKLPQKKTTLLKKLQALWLPVTIVGVGGAGVGAVGIKYLPPLFSKNKPAKGSSTGSSTDASGNPIKPIKADRAGWEKEARQRSQVAKTATEAELANLQGLNPTALQIKVDASKASPLGTGGLFQVGVLEGDLLSRIPIKNDPISTPKVIYIKYPEEIKGAFEAFSHIFSLPVGAIVNGASPLFQSADASLSMKEATDPYSYEKKDRATILRKMEGKPLPRAYLDAFRGLGGSGSNNLNPNLTRIKANNEMMTVFSHLYSDQGFFSEGIRLKYLNEFLDQCHECLEDPSPNAKAGVNKLLAETLFGAGTSKTFAKATVNDFMQQYKAYTSAYRKSLEPLEKLPPSAYEDMVGLLHTMEQWNTEHLDELILPDFQHGWNILVSDEQFSLIDVCVGARASMRQNFNYDHTSLITQFGKVVFGAGCLTEGANPCHQPHNMLGMPINTATYYPLELPEGQLSDLQAYRETAACFVENLTKACQKLDIKWDAGELKAWLKIR